MEHIQYTVRGVPGYLDSRLREYAREKTMSLNAALVDLLSAGLGLLRQRSRNEELVSLAGSWVEDPDMDKAFADMDRVDEDMWK